MAKTRAENIVSLTNNFHYLIGDHYLYLSVFLKKSNKTKASRIHLKASQLTNQSNMKISLSLQIIKDLSSFPSALSLS